MKLRERADNDRFFKEAGGLHDFPSYLFSVKKKNSIYGLLNIDFQQVNDRSVPLFTSLPKIIVF